MALTVCAYCDKYFGESKSHCGQKQMDDLLHAEKIAEELEDLAKKEENGLRRQLPD